MSTCLILGACASSSAPEPEGASADGMLISETEGSAETEESAESEETTGTEESAETEETTVPETSEETTEEETTPEEETFSHLGITDGILKYEDVRGYFFRTEFHEDWPQNDYDQSAFVMTDGRMTYTGEGYTYRLGIDVYEAYGYIDWTAVKEDGYDFAFMRIGYRGYAQPDLLVDRNWIINLHDAYLAGMDVGVYFFSQAITEEEAKEEADFIIETLTNDGYTPDILKMGVAFDPEYTGDSGARTNDLTRDQVTKNARAFCDRIREAGYTAMIYSNMVWEDRNFDLSQLSDIDIWYADYTAYPQTPYAFSVWQYGHGESKGVEGAVDVNIQLIPVGEELTESDASSEPES